MRPHIVPLLAYTACPSISHTHTHTTPISHSIHFPNQAVKDWVAAPDNFTCDFTELPAVAQLESDSAAAPFLRLLRAMLAGDMAAYRAAAAPAVLEGVPVAQVRGGSFVVGGGPKGPGGGAPALPRRARRAVR